MCPANVRIFDVVNNREIRGNDSLYYVKHTTTFNCSADGFPALNYSWSLNGTGASAGNQFTVNFTGLNVLTCHVTLDMATPLLCKSQTVSINIFIFGERLLSATFRIMLTHNQLIVELAVTLLVINLDSTVVSSSADLYFFV